MKRTALKRGAGLARKTALKATDSLKQSKPLERHTRLRAVSPGKVPRRAGYDYQEFVLSVCFTRTRDGYQSKPCRVCGAPATDAHHVIPKQMLHRVGAVLRMDMEEVVQILMDSRNGLALCRPCHDRHESATRRVPWRLLDERTFAFARWLDSKAHTEACMVYLEKTYPR